MFVTAAADEKMTSWIDCHVKALEYIGKLPAVIVPDNASTATYKPRRNSSYRMVTNRYADFGSYYDITIVPTRPGRPRDKAAVERAVSIAYKRILGYFDGEVFHSLEDLNEAITTRVEDINTVMTRADGTTRRQRFDLEEKPVMRHLPATPFTQVVWKRLKVDRNWHVTCDYQHYSVPYTLIGKTLVARVTPQVVSLFDGDLLVAEHTRLTGFKYRYSTDPQHSPHGQDTTHKALTRDELIRWASSFGPATQRVVEMILARHSAAIPRGLIQARNVLANLGKKHHKTTLEPACQQVLDKKLVPTFSVIKRIQTDIAHTTIPEGASARSKDTGRATDHARTKAVTITPDLHDAVFIRPVDHYKEK